MSRYCISRIIDGREILMIGNVMVPKAACSIRHRKSCVPNEPDLKTEALQLTFSCSLVVLSLKLMYLTIHKCTGALSASEWLPLLLPPRFILRPTQRCTRTDFVRRLTQPPTTKLRNQWMYLNVTYFSSLKRCRFDILVAVMTSTITLINP